MWRWLDELHVHWTLNRAARLIANGDQQAGIAMADRLRGKKYPQYYEFLAQAHLSDFDHEAAVAVLREAVGLFPDSLDMRLRLSTALSDARHLDEALSQLIAAQAMPDAEAERLILDYNKAIILMRKGDIDAALEITWRLLSDPDLLGEEVGLRCLVHAEHVRLLARSGKVELAIRFHEANVGDLDMATNAALAQQAGVWESYAFALVEAGRFAEAEAAIQSGLDRDLSHAGLFGVWRLMHGGPADVERDYMQVYVISAASRSGKPHAVCLVAADDVGEALDLIRVFMPAPLDESLAAWHVQHMERRAMQKGVYAIKPLAP